MLILLFVLLSLDKNSSMQDSLKTFLGFYKENRELITALMGGMTAPQTAAKTADPPTMSEERQKESRPVEKADSLNILEQYLKRIAV